MLFGDDTGACCRLYERENAILSLREVNGISLRCSLLCSKLCSCFGFLLCLFRFFGSFLQGVLGWCTGCVVLGAQIFCSLVRNSNFLSGIGKLFHNDGPCSL